MSTELIAILGVGAALDSVTAGLFARMRADILRLHRRIDGFIAEAGNDRRAFQASMDGFRWEI